MQAAFQWRFPGLFLHIFLYTFFYFHAASDPAHLLSQHFGCYCCPAFSLASPFVFPFFSYLTLHLPAHFLYQHFGCYYCLIIFPRFPFRSFFSHISNVFNLLIFYHNTSVVIAARFSPWPSASHFLRVSHRLIFYANALVSITPWLSLLSLPLLPSLFSLPIFFFCLISWVIFYRTPLVVITSYLSLLVPFFSVPTLYS